jgi:CRP-like cAMP-binding protein
MVSQKRSSRGSWRAAGDVDSGKNEVVFHEGDPGDSLHPTAKGHFAGRVTTPMGDVATLQVLRAGGAFGELAPEGSTAH